MDITSNKYNIELASYFQSKSLYLDEPTQKKPNIRKLVEQPWQQTKGKLWDEVTETLCNLDFIQAKAATKMTYELVNDFNLLLNELPENSENVRKEIERQIRLNKYAIDLVNYANGVISVLEVPETINPYNKHITKSEFKRSDSKTNRLTTIINFRNFLGKESSNLQRYAYKLPRLSKQQAWIFAENGPVGNAVNKEQSDIWNYLLLRTLPLRPEWKAYPIVLNHLKEHKSSIQTLVMTPNGRIAGAGSDDDTCIIWDLTSGKPIFTYMGDKRNVEYLAISQDGKIAFSRSNENSTLTLHDLSSGQPTLFLKGHSRSVRSIAITPNLKYAFTGSDDKRCILWDLVEGKQIKILIGHHEAVNVVALTPNGEIALSGSMSARKKKYSFNDNKITYSGKTDATFILWDLTSGKQINTFKGHSQGVSALAITPDGKIAVSGSSDKICIHWDLTTGKPLRTFKGHSSGVLAVDITPDGKRLISGSADNSCILWDLTTGRRLLTLAGHISLVTSVAISPDAQIAISGSYDKSCIVWDLSNMIATNTFKQFSDWISSTASNFVALKFRGSIGRHSNSITSISIMPDGKSAVSGSSDKTCILWNLSTKRPIKKFDGHKKCVNAVAISPDGKRLISGDEEGNIILWDLITGQILKALNLPEFSFKKESTFLPNGKMIVLKSDLNCILLDLSSYEFIDISILDTHFVNTFAYTPDGKRAVSASKDNTCILWDLDTGQQIFTLKGHKGYINTLAITPDGKMAISGSFDKTCICWDLSTGKLIAKLLGHTDRITSVIITPDGKRAITSSDDNTCILWDLKNGKLIAQYISTSPITKIVNFSDIIFGGEDSGEVFILHIGKKLMGSCIGTVTIKQIWDFEANKYQELSVICPFCGHKFNPSRKVLTTIQKITELARLSDRQSPCLDMPLEFSMDPSLFNNCPNCDEKLKFNPFIVKSENYISTLKHNIEFLKNNNDNKNKEILIKLKELSFLLNNQGFDSELALLSEEIKELTFLIKTKSEAIDHLYSKEFSKSKEQLETLLQFNFDVLFSRFYLTLIAIITDNYSEATKQIELAWALHTEAKPYAIARILFIKFCLVQIIAGNEYDINIILGQFKTLLMISDGIFKSDLRHLLGFLKPKLNDIDYILLSALINAWISKEKILELEKFELWNKAESLPIE